MSSLLSSLPSGIAALALIAAWQYRAKAQRWQARSQHWFSVAMGEKPLIDESGATRLMRDLFPGTIPHPGVNVPSVERDVMSQREWRERRALLSRDHTTRHTVEGALTDSEAATEIMQFCIGGLETERGE